ncbi:unnamed protein product [Lactuca saligna]|uniref:Uncharacterized protein n=1 Tax=Lactuca saligna TaxID=75948 RepID=A0AA35UNT9_LACSI|nr:unnamed protein product [Lactuca saligna]
MWAFDPEWNMWVVKRNSGVSEYYKSVHDFNSWTKVDLAELSSAPFHNPSEDPSTSNFKRFLDRQVKENFSRMISARALYRKDKEIMDPKSGEPMKIIIWPTTKQQKENLSLNTFVRYILIIWNYGRTMMKLSMLP